MTAPRTVFRQAIDDGNGSINVGYLALYWAMVVWSVVAVGVLALGGLALLHAPDAADRAAIIQAIGVAEGANATGFGVVVGAVGFYLMGDARTPPPQPQPLQPQQPTPAPAPRPVVRPVRGRAEPPPEDQP